MVANSCNNCFYAQNESNQHPCSSCKDFNKFVRRDIYIQTPDTVTIRNWDNQDAFVQTSSFDDAVTRPKHYMVFSDLGIEVRHILSKLAAKFDHCAYPKDPLFVSDYVQMMQYGMRFMEKNGKQDLEKMRWYLDKMIEAYERDNP